MSHPTATLIGAIAGAGAGYICKRLLPIPSAAQTIVAVVVGVFFGNLAKAALWLLRPAPDAEVLAVSIGLGEILLTLGATLMVGTALHLALGWLAAAVHPGFAAHRAVILGLLGGVCGALGAPSGIAIVRPLR